MNCPECHSVRVTVIDSVRESSGTWQRRRDLQDLCVGNVVARLRRCGRCAHEFTTVERVEAPPERPHEPPIQCEYVIGEHGRRGATAKKMRRCDRTGLWVCARHVACARHRCDQCQRS